MKPDCEWKTLTVRDPMTPVVVEAMTMMQTLWLQLNSLWLLVSSDLSPCYLSVVIKEQIF